jgi:transcription factor SPN1
MSDVESPIGSPPKRLEDDDDLSDKESLLSEIDENEFDDYDPETANIENRPVNIDEDVARTLKASKRKVADGDKPRKPREGRRENKRARDEDGPADGKMDGKRARKSRRTDDSRAGKSKVSPEPEAEENLTPAERRARAIERALDAAAKGPSKRRKRKDEIVRPLLCC